MTGSKREPAAPELPTMAEAGVQGFEASSWHGLFVPVRTSPQIIKKMNADAISALAEPAVRRKLEQNGYGIVGSNPEGLATLLKSEIDKWGTVIKEAGIRIE